MTANFWASNSSAPHDGWRIREGGLEQARQNGLSFLLRSLCVCVGGGRTVFDDDEEGQ